MASFPKASRNTVTPRIVTIAGAFEILSVYERYIPNTDPSIPIIQLQINLFFQLSVNRVADAAGAMSSVKTRNMPPMGTAFTITRLKVI